jgi:hypothetical protein
MNGAGLGPEISTALLDVVVAEPSRDVSKETLELFFEDKRLVNNRGIDDLLANRANPGADAAQKPVAAAAFSREGQKLELVGRLGEVATPTYLIWGEFDRVIPVGHAAKAAEAIKGSWLDVIPGSGHVPQVEAAATVSSLVRHWLTRLPAAEPEPEPEPAAAEGEPAAPEAAATSSDQPAAGAADGAPADDAQESQGGEDQGAPDSAPA